MIKFRHCPYIATLFDFFEDAENIYLVMEYCGGGTLDEAIGTPDKKRAYDFQTNEDAAANTLSVLHQISVALACMHGHSIAHFDLQPENVLLKKIGEIRVCDLGISSIVGQDTPMRGTMLYRAPERYFKEELHSTLKSDMWSLGVVLYKMIFRGLPFHKRGKSLKFNLKQKNPLEARVTFLAQYGINTWKMFEEALPVCAAITRACLLRDHERRLSVFELKAYLEQKSFCELFVKGQPLPEDHPLLRLAPPFAFEDDI